MFSSLWEFVYMHMFFNTIFLWLYSITVHPLFLSFFPIALPVKANYLFFSASSGRWGCTCICLATWSSSTSTASRKFKPYSQYWRLSWPPPSGPCLDQYEEDSNIISMIMVIHCYQHHKCSSCHNSLRGIQSTPLTHSVQHFAQKLINPFQWRSTFPNNICIGNADMLMF